MERYLNLLANVLEQGELVEARNGRTRRLLGQSISFPMLAFPIITSRRIHWKGVFGECMAFLRGYSTNDKFQEFDCNYWTPFARQWSTDHNSLGRIYGVQWRDWRGEFGHIDQITELMQSIREDPHSRRHIVTAWRPDELHEMALPPCHTMFQMHCHGDHELSCTVTMRSVDVCLGLPSDMVLYGMLLELIAHSVGRVPRTLYFHFGDCHVYENHFDLAFEQVKVVPAVAETEFVFLPDFQKFAGGDILNAQPHHFELRGYKPFGAIHYPLNI